MNSSKGIPIGAAVLVAFAVWAVSAVILETAGEGAAWNIAWYLVGRSRRRPSPTSSMRLVQCPEAVRPSTVRCT
jgi:hypothetical protein